MLLFAFLLPCDLLFELCSDCIGMPKAGFGFEGCIAVDFDLCWFYVVCFGVAFGFLLCLILSFDFDRYFIGVLLDVCFHFVLLFVSCS